jgi:hypothetical protein
VLPAFTLALGVASGAAEWIGGDPEDGAKAFGLMAVLALVLAVGARKNETVDLINAPDERWRTLDRAATAFAGIVLVAVLIGAWLWEVAHGRDGEPYTQLCVIGGASYIAALTYLRFRG